MGDMMKENPQQQVVTCCVCGKKSVVSLRRVVNRNYRYRCPVCDRAAHMSMLTGNIADVDRRGSGSDSMLTALFHSEISAWEIPAGYFCVQQSSEAFRYMLVPQGNINPRAVEYVESGKYTDWIPGYFSKTLKDDICGTKRIEISDLPAVLRDMTVSIGIREGGSSVCGGVLEVFRLCKRKHGNVEVVWTLEFPGSFGNQGAGGSDPVPSKFFRNCDLPGFAEYMAGKYRALECTADEILRNGEIRHLFELCSR